MISRRIRDDREPSIAALLLASDDTVDALPPEYLNQLEKLAERREHGARATAAMSLPHNAPYWSARNFPFAGDDKMIFQ